MGEEFADSPLQNRTYAIKNVGTGRYVALKGVGQEIYTVSTSSDNEARWRVEKDNDKYTMVNREHDTYAAIAGVVTNEIVKGNQVKTSWSIKPTTDHASTHNFFITSVNDAYWNIGDNAANESDVNPKIPVTVSDSSIKNATWKFVKV